MALYASPFKAIHAKRLNIQDAQAEELTFAIGTADLAACENEHAFTVWDDNIVLACGGLIPVWTGRAMAWVLLADEARRHFPYLSQFTRKVFQASGFRRIEATVLTGFRQGHRWVEALGFDLETPKGMKSYSPEGLTMSLYAWTKGADDDRH